MRTLTRYILLGVGVIALAFGVIGIVMPMWPTTPFLLLAVACFVRSSERLHRWLLHHPVLGCYITDFVSGRGVPRRVKVMALSFTGLTTVVSTAVVFAVSGVSALSMGYALMLALVLVGVSWYVGWRIPTAPPRSGECQGRETTS